VASVVSKLHFFVIFSFAEHLSSKLKPQKNGAEDNRIGREQRKETKTKWGLKYGTNNK
jgi:hypothetical protein